VTRWLSLVLALGALSPERCFDMPQKIKTVIDATTGQPIPVSVGTNGDGNPGPVNRANQGIEQTILLADGSATFSGTAQDIAAGSPDLVDVDAFVEFDFSLATEVDESPTISQLAVELVDQDGGNIGATHIEQFRLTTFDNNQGRVFCARFVGRIIGTGQIHPRFTLGNGGDTTLTCGIVKAQMSWIVRPILGDVFSPL
jgi:hypothetical protein